MANRSYIYGLKDDNHFGMGECPYNIPYAYQVLAAYDNEVVDSHLFDKRVGIVANFSKGKEALYWFLDYLCAGKCMADHAEFEKQVSLTKGFIDAINADKILLENGEIYALYQSKEGTYLDGEGLERVNCFACEDYKWIGEDIDNLKAANVNPANLFTIPETEKYWKWMLELKDNWKEKLLLDSWRSILYFHFKEA